MDFGHGLPGLRLLDVDTRESTLLETGAEGVFSPDGRWIALTEPVGGVFVRGVEGGAPVPLFQTRIIQPALVLFQYDVTPDGQRFLVNSLPREDAAAPLTLLVSWTAAIGR